MVVKMPPRAESMPADTAVIEIGPGPASGTTAGISDPTRSCNSINMLLNHIKTICLPQ